MSVKVCPNNNCPMSLHGAMFLADKVGFDDGDQNCGLCQTPLVRKSLSTEDDQPGASQAMPEPSSYARTSGNVSGTAATNHEAVARPIRRSAGESPQSEVCPILCELTTAREESTGLTLGLSVSVWGPHPFSGDVWLSDDTGRDGDRKPIFIDAHSTTTVRPVFRTEDSFAGVLMLRIRPKESLSGFWETEILLHRANNTLVISPRQTNESADDSVNINRMTQNITVNATEISSSDPMPLEDFRFRGPKSKVHSESADRYNRREFLAVACSRPGKQTTVVEDIEAGRSLPPARLTLIHEGDGTADCAARTHLLAGSEFFVGRNRTRPQEITDPAGVGTSMVRKKIPNPFPDVDVTLRTKHGTEDASYISGYAFRLSIEAEQVRVQSLSANATEFKPPPGPDGRISRDCRIMPGARALPMPGHEPSNRLQVQLKQRKLPFRREHYHQFCDDYGLVPPPPGSAVSIGVSRSDAVREDYVFLRVAVFVGTGDSCAWSLNGSDVRRRHACLLWLDDCFWIEPWENDAFVEVDGLRIRRHQLHRLLPGSHVVIGSRHFSIAESFSQHIVDCGHCVMAKPPKMAKRSR